MSFIKSLNIGKIGEGIVCDILNHHKLNASIVNQKDSHDIEFYINNSIITGEVKYDVMAKKTGNVAIEFFNSKKMSSSGISKTKAMVWFVVFNNDEVYYTLVNQLHNYIQLKQPKRIVYSAGDGNADLLLYSKDVIISDIFIELNKNKDSLKMMYEMV